MMSVTLCCSWLAGGKKNRQQQEQRGPRPVSSGTHQGPGPGITGVVAHRRSRVQAKGRAGGGRAATRVALDAKQAGCLAAGRVGGYRGGGGRGVSLGQEPRQGVPALVNEPPTRQRR